MGQRQNPEKEPTNALLVVDIPYTSGSSMDELHTFDLYISRDGSLDSSKAPLICFVHGGAWRSEDKADHHDLAVRLAVATQCAIAVPNYRLTPTNPIGHDMLIHPAHAEDILQFLSFMLTWPGPDSYTVNAATAYDPRNLYLMGHSCAAHMLTSIFLNSSAVTPTLTPSPLLIESVRGIILSEGIYDIDLLISSFPSYREWFIADAFGDQTSYPDVATTKLPLWSSDTHMRWLIIHSEKDTLVDLRQSEAIWNHLNDVHAEAGLVPEEFVFREMEGLIWGHNEILRQPEFIELAKGFISDNCTVRISN